MTRPNRRTILAPLFAVLAILLGVSGSASGAFNHAATEVHYEDFLLWETKALGVPAFEIADPTRGNGEWVYDDASGVLFYVRQNPWTYWDPLGLSTYGRGTLNGGGSDDQVKKVIQNVGASIWSGLARAGAKVGHYLGENTYAARATNARNGNAGIIRQLTPAGQKSQDKHVAEIRKGIEEVTGGKVNPAIELGGELMLPVPPVLKAVKGMRHFQNSSKLTNSMRSTVKGSRSEVEAAIARLKKNGVNPMPGQRDLNTDHVLRLAKKMENGEWDDAISYAEKNRPGVMINSDGTETIISGHHRHVAAEVARGRGKDIKMSREELTTTTDTYKGDWDDVGRASDSSE